MPSIKLLKRAETELFEASKWYEEQRKGLSLSFRKEIRYTLNLISNTPLIYAKQYDTENRFAVVNRFPFIIIFWFNNQLDTVFVISIFNTNRSTKQIPK